MHYLNVIIVFGYLGMCLLNGGIAGCKQGLWRGTRLTFWGTVLASVFLTPVLVFLVLLFIPNRTMPPKNPPSA